MAAEVVGVIHAGLVLPPQAPDPAGVDILGMKRLAVKQDVRERRLGRLAEEGARIETVVAPTSWTLPSHITLLTGLPPESHGVVNDYTRLSSSVRSAHGGRRAADTTAELWITSELLASQTERLLHDWDQRRRKRPFFLFLHMWDVHFDYIPPAGFRPVPRCGL